eukprot:7082970-Prymnesium_polylepis.1
MNVDDFKEGTAYVAVRCSAAVVSFRVRALTITAPLAVNVASSGEVCAEEWVYHHYTATASHSGTGKRAPRRDSLEPMPARPPPRVAAWLARRLEC